MHSVTLIVVAVALAAVSGLPQSSTTTSTTPTTSTTTLSSVTNGSTTAKLPESSAGQNLTFVLSGSDIPTKDSYSEVDAFVKLYGKTGKSDEEARFGTTEHVPDNKDPEWAKVFWYFWTPGSGDTWRFVVRDHDVLAADDEVGEVIVNVDEYVKKGQDMVVNLSEGGKLKIKKTEPFSFKLNAKNLPRMDNLGGKSDPYVEVYWRRGQEGADTLVGSTAVVDNEDHPTWSEVFEFGNYQKGTNQYLYFKVLDSDAVTTDDILGDILVEADSYAAGKAAKTLTLEHSVGKALLVVTPVSA